MKFNWFRFGIIILLTLFIGISGGLGYFAYRVYSVEELDEINQPQTSRFYYEDDELMTNNFVENRTNISLEEVSKEVIWATIAVEDRRFYEHNGFDIVGIARAAHQNLQEGEIKQGGSTITQQLAKNLFLTHDRNWQRKLDEAAITIHLEKNLTKDEILEKYLNTIYYGHSTYGIEAAAKLYFDKSASQLSLEEAALLVGLPRGPGYYSPFIDEDAAYNRQKTVLNLMKEEGFISKREKDKALAKELSFSEKPNLSRESNYVVEQILNKELSELSKEDPDIIQKGGLELYTTIDEHMQSEAERILKEELVKHRKDEEGVKQPQAALVAIEPGTGKIRALAGGRDYQKTRLNRAILPRSPGSAFKPIVYATALENYYTAADTFHCEPVSFKEEGMEEPYEPTDFGGGYHNEELTLREALRESCNITALKLNQELGAPNSLDMASRLGIESEIGNHISMPLGTSELTLLELTTAYGAFANGGNRVEPLLLKEAKGPNGESLINNSPKKERVLEEGVAYLMTDMMKDVLDREGTASRAGEILDRPAAGKTGTSQGYKNVYMVGYTPDLVVGIFIGDDKEAPLGETGGSLAAPLWAEFMEEASREIPVRDFERPDNIVEKNLCKKTGAIQSTDCTASKEKEIFIEGTEPEKECSKKDCPEIEEPSWWEWDFWW